MPARRSLPLPRSMFANVALVKMVSLLGVNLSLRTPLPALVPGLQFASILRPLSTPVQHVIAHQTAGRQNTVGNIFKTTSRRSRSRSKRHTASAPHPVPAATGFSAIGSRSAWPGRNLLFADYVRATQFFIVVPPAGRNLGLQIDRRAAVRGPARQAGPTSKPRQL
jgi:hypothetical protein